VPTILDTMDLVEALEPLEAEGWSLFAGGSTLKRGRGRDIDVLIVGEPGRERSDLRARLPELGIEALAPHLGEDGEESGLGFVGRWRGFDVDLGVDG
jgi:hypothetical protein